MSGLRIAGHVLVRLLLGFCIFYFGLRPSDAPPSDSPPPNLKPAVQPTSNLDLQLARLYWRTNGIWTPQDYRALNDLLRARGDFDILARLSPPDERTVPLLLRAAQEQIAAQEWDALAQTLAQVLALEADHPEANFWMGLLQVSGGDPLGYLEKAAAAAGPYQATAAAILGIVRLPDYALRDVALRLIESGEWAWAERLLTLQLGRDSLDALSYAYRGFARDQQGRDGLADIQTAIALDPALPLAFYMLGLHYRGSGEFDLSLQAFLDAHLLDPQNPALAAELAAAYQLNDDLPSAEAWFKEAARLAPDDERFIGLLVAFYADTGYQVAENGYAVVEKAANDYPENVSIQTSWGRVLFLADDFERAKEVYEKTLTLAPSDPRLRYYYGELLERQGDTVAALEQYFGVAQGDSPYREAAQQGIARLSR